MRHELPVGLRLRLAIAICSGLLAGGCVARPEVPAASPGDTVRVRTAERGVEVERDVPTEDYVAATALSEFSPAAGDPAAVAAMFDVQAIVARSYAQLHRGRHAAEGFDLCSTTHCQIYEPGRLGTSRWAAAAREAARRTAGLILTYQGRPAEAVFHADCGGATSAAADVWNGGGLPYLRAQRDDGEAQAAHAAWQYAVEAEALRRALDSDPRTRGSGRIAAIVVLSRDGAGRAGRVRLHGAADVEVSGTTLREVLAGAFGARSIRSTLFEVASNGRQLVFTGRGFGHGVGLCQAGAFARVAAGDRPEAVLRRYYPGTAIAPAASLRPSSRRPPG